jgi:hypothetical protein
MLQWTCRLRDVLERHGVLVLSQEDQARLSTMKEVEFVSSESAVFPDEFRWDTFNGCLDRPYGCEVSLWAPTYEHSDRLFASFDPNDPTSQSIRSLSGRPVTDFTKGDISIVWLSSSVFISPIQFTTFYYKGLVVDYDVYFHNRAKDSSIQCYVHSLSGPDGEDQEPSLLPLLFMSHLTATLPVDYFSSLWLQRYQCNLERSPVDFIVRFLSIMSNSDIRPPAGEKQVTTFALYAWVTADELPAIMSYRFDPTVTLAFYRCFLDSSVTLEIMMDCLKNAHHLRSIVIPGHLFRVRPAEDSAKGVEISVQSQHLSLRSWNATLSPQVFHEISNMYPPSGITVSFALWEEGTRYGLRLISSFFHPFLDGRLAAHGLEVGFGYFHRFNDDSLNRLVERITSEMIPCKSKTLCAFKVSLSKFREIPSGHHTFDRIMRWDQVIFPSVVLNYFRIRVAHLLEVQVLPMAILAINRGSLYRKTTDHVPYDMSLANAGAIFSSINTQSRSGFPGGKQYRRAVLV